MECDGGLVSPNDQDEEDWMDTNWSDPNISSIFRYDRKSLSQQMDSGHKLSVGPNLLDPEENSIKMTNEVNFTSHPKSLFNNGRVINSTETSNEAPMLSRMQLNDNKAGMDGIDKEKINKIIFEASKGSKYFENEKKKEAQLNRRIEEERKKKKRITELELRQAAIEADKVLEELEKHRSLSRFIVHVDMDAYYAAVETRDDPSLRDKPIAVGSSSMLSTSNYLARKFGVRAAMPGFIGKKLCPKLIIVKPNFKQYTSISKQVRDVMAHYDPNFCPMSLDEAYLDFTNHMERRKTMTVRERTVLCRVCDPAQTTVCFCDLNSCKNAPFENGSSELEECQPSYLGEVTHNDMGKSTENNFADLDENEVHVREITINSPGLRKDSGLARKMATSQRADNSSTNVCELCRKPYPACEVKVFGRSIDAAVREMRCRIEQRTRLTASAGIACNVMLAKVCSDKNKPNGQYRIDATRKSVMDFVKELPIRKICGIGKISEKMLNALGVMTCEDLYHQRATLYLLYSQMSFTYFMRISLGMGSTMVDRDGERKSMSTERTFTEISDVGDLYNKCRELCQSLSDDLREAGLKGRTVTLKLKTVKFEVTTRATSLTEYTSNMQDLYTASSELLKHEILNISPQKLTLRLMGVRMSNLVHQNVCQTVKQDTITGMFKKMTSRTVDNNDQRVTESSKSFTVHDREQRVTGSSSTSNVCDEIAASLLDASDGEDDKTNKSHHSNVIGSKLCSVKNYKILKTDHSIQDKDKLLENVHDISGFSKQSVSIAGDTVLLNFKTDRMAQANDTRKLNSNEIVKDKLFQNTHATSGSNRQGVCVVNDMIPVEFKDDQTAESNDGRKLQSGMIMQDRPTEHVHDTSSSNGLDVCVANDTILLEQQQNFDCPVCGETVVCKNLNYFNDHVDICLFKQIKQSNTFDALCEHDVDVSSSGSTTASACKYNGTAATVEMVKPVGQNRDTQCQGRLGESGTIPSVEMMSQSDIDHTKATESEDVVSNKMIHQSHVKLNIRKTMHVGEDKSDHGTAYGNRMDIHNGLHGSDVDDKFGVENGQNSRTVAEHKIVHKSKEENYSNETRQDVSTVCGCGEMLDGVSSGEMLDGVSGGEMLDGVSDGEMFYVCPVCNAEKQGWSISDFNDHIDACLSRSAIKDILREQETSHRKAKRAPSEEQTQSLAKKGRKSSSTNTRSIKTFFTR